MANIRDQQLGTSPRKQDAHTGLTRRDVLAGAAVATGVVTVAGGSSPANARPDPNLREDMVAFVLLSWALTGIAPDSLAPTFGRPPPPPNTDLLALNPGTDPIDIKTDYFKWITAQQPVTFERLLKIVKDNRTSPTLAATIMQKVQADPDTTFLARSIVLLWYLGSWYDPQDLKTASPKGAFIPSRVVSAKTYTQGWIWRIAQAHPMGYSELQFGYWSRPPVDPNGKPPLAFLTDKLS
jgi:hypothetical protein